MKSLLLLLLLPVLALAQTQNSVYLDVSTSANNTVTIEQGNNARTVGVFSVELDILANSNNNTINITQHGNNSKTLSGTVSDNNNLIATEQRGSGSHVLEFVLTGGGHGLTTLQRDSGSHTLNVQLTNTAGGITAEIIQKGTTPQTLQVIQNCMNPQGCGVTVIQGN